MAVRGQTVIFDLQRGSLEPGVGEEELSELF